MQFYFTNRFRGNSREVLRNEDKRRNMKRYCPQTSQISFEVLVTLIRLTNPAFKWDWASICLQALFGVMLLPGVELHKYTVCVRKHFWPHINSQTLSVLCVIVILTSVAIHIYKTFFKFPIHSSHWFIGW